MNCEQAAELMSAMLDGELTPQEQQALSAHLAQCEQCRALLEALRAADAAFKNEQSEPPACLREHVMAQIHRQSAQSKRRSVRNRVLGALAVAAAAAFILLSALDVIHLPGMNEVSHASVSVGQSMQDMLPQTAQTPEEAAQQLCRQSDCTVLLLYSDTVPQALSALSYETRADGSRLFCTDEAALERLLSAFDEAAWQLFAPEQPAQQTLYVLLLPASAQPN